jgi:hypothetical protein
LKTASDVLASAPGRLKRLSTRSRKRPISCDERHHSDHWRLKASFCRLKDFRRVATRDDTLAANFALAAIIAFWC